MSRDYLNKDSAKSGLWLGISQLQIPQNAFILILESRGKVLHMLLIYNTTFPRFFLFFRIKLPMHFKPREHTKYQNVSAVMKVRKIICAYGLALISKLSRSWNWTCILKEQNHFLSCICCTWKEFFLLNYRTGRHFQIRTPWNIYKLEHE